MFDDLLKRRVLLIVGKGGVGKTVLAAAIATTSARRGARTLAMECDVRAPMADLLDAQPSFVARDVSERLSAIVLEGSHALEEYLRMVVPGRAVLNAIFASRLYQYFVQAAPGLKELMMLGKLYYESELRAGSRRKWNLIVVDAPASGQALSL